MTVTAAVLPEKYGLEPRPDRAVGEVDLELPDGLVLVGDVGAQVLGGDGGHPLPFLVCPGNHGAFGVPHLSRRSRIRGDDNGLHVGVHHFQGDGGIH